MADLSGVSTYQVGIQGNRRIVSVDVGASGATTSDTVSIPYLSAVTNIIGGYFRIGDFTTVATTVLAGPFFTIGSSANTVQIVRSSLAAFGVHLSVEGR